MVLPPQLCRHWLSQRWEMCVIAVCGCLLFLLQVCVQLKMCPPPSMFSVQAAMLRSKFNKFSSSTKFIRDY
jgi:hypothetical protein